MIADGACEVCGDPVPRQAGPGRPARYCSAACRTRRWRERRACAPTPAERATAAGRLLRRDIADLVRAATDDLDGELVAATVSSARASLAELLQAVAQAQAAPPPAAQQAAPGTAPGTVPPVAEEPASESPIQHRRQPRLGPGWTVTTDDMLTSTLWREQTPIGTVRRGAGFFYGSGRGAAGWEARPGHGRLIVRGPRPGGLHSSRANALQALADDHEQRIRATTPHAEAALEDREGWTLTQTQAEHAAAIWRVIAPDGTYAGRVQRPSWDPRRWQALAGNPEDQHTPISEIHPATLGLNSQVETWSTRRAAAHAVAAWHDPDLPLPRNL